MKDQVVTATQPLHGARVTVVRVVALGVLAAYSARLALDLAPLDQHVGVGPAPALRPLGLGRRVRLAPFAHVRGMTGEAVSPVPQVGFAAC